MWCREGVGRMWRFGRAGCNNDDGSGKRVVGGVQGCCGGFVGDRLRVLLAPPSRGIFDK